MYTITLGNVRSTVAVRFLLFLKFFFFFGRTRGIPKILHLIVHQCGIPNQIQGISQWQ